MKQLLFFNLVAEIVLIYVSAMFLGENVYTEDVFIFSVIVWVIGVFISENYFILKTTGLLANNIQYLRLLVNVSLLSLVYIFFTEKQEFVNAFTLYFIFLLLFTLVIWRNIMLFMMKRLQAKKAPFSRLIIVGLSDEVMHFKNFIEQKKEYKVQVDGIFSDISYGNISITDTIDQSIVFCQQHPIDQIICSMEQLNKKYLASLIEFAENNLINIRIIPDSSRVIGQNFETTFIDNIPLLKLKDKPLNKKLNAFLKRAFDIAFSLSVILFIFPWLFPIIILFIMIDSRGPIFFRQQRTGQFNSSFPCIKFRTMVVNNDAHKEQARKGDPRVTKVGAFLRKTSLDELPQFFNVLIGDMSIVGPRPHMVKHTEEYSKLIDTYMRRHQVKPGITGLAQVMGYRGETQHDLHLMKMRVRMDRFYIENWSFYLDFKIIYSTIITVFKPKNEVY